MYAHIIFSLQYFLFSLESAVHDLKFAQVTKGVDFFILLLHPYVFGRGWIQKVKALNYSIEENVDKVIKIIT